MTENIISIIQIVVAILLIVVVLMQNRGSGLGSLFGGGEGNVYQTKRGADKFLFWITIVLVVLFLGFALVRFII